MNTSVSMLLAHERRRPNEARLRCAVAAVVGLSLLGTGVGLGWLPGLDPLSGSGGASVAAAFAGRNGRVVFESNRVTETNPEGDYEIYTIKVGEQQPRQLTMNEAWDEQPTWSPEGDRLAFTSNRDGQREIYTMRADGSGQTNRTNDGAEDTDPAWSPDGKRIAFTSTRVGNGSIFILRLNSFLPPSNVAGIWGSEPAWSPDGRFLAFRAPEGIFKVRPNGADLLQLTFADPSGPSETSDSSPAWSPDGTRIAFDRWGEAEGWNGDINSVRSDGANLLNISQSPGFDDRDPAWSPDGEQIVFGSLAGNSYDIIRMRANGLGLVIVSPGGGFVNQDPDWQPRPLRHQRSRR